MCGILGQVRLDGRSVDEATLARMCRALEHRGPDSRGMLVDGGVGLAMQRLKVVDLETGEQPIANEDGTVQVLLNGEIYNFLELRRELEQRGHRFKTKSDTEVIVHLYEEHGPACVERLHGMFGLAVWDARERRLTLARDRLGKKPLFYAYVAGALRFASELAALMQDPEIPADVDHQALDAYLAYRWVPTPMTAFRAARKLPAASVLTLQDGALRIERYWDCDYGTKRSFTDEREVHEEIRDQIRAAVRRRLIADVPLGAFLSGGVDSTAVVAAMSEATPEPVKTFSVGFQTDSYNELPLARLTADRFSTDHHELMAEPDTVEVVPELVRHFGEPFADPGAIPAYYVAKLARRHVTVALNGDGGDEAFAGYTRYAAQVALARAGAVPLRVRRLLAQAAARLPNSGEIDSWTSRARRVGASLLRDPADRYIAYMTELNGLSRARLYKREYRELVGTSVADDVVAEPWAASSATNLIDRMLDVDRNTYLVDDLLVKMDIVTMANSLEARAPLLDQEFVAFAASLPPEQKLRGTRKKVGLRAALRGWIPDEVLDAPKRGFRPPIAEWLRGDLRVQAHDVLLDRTARERGYFEDGYVTELLRQHSDRRRDHSQAIWTLLNFELWHREFVDGVARHEPGGEAVSAVSARRDQS